MILKSFDSFFLNWEKLRLIERNRNSIKKILFFILEFMSFYSKKKGENLFPPFFKNI